MPRYADVSCDSADELALWNELVSHQGEVFTTAKGLPFTYVVRGNEIFVDRRKKSITRATVRQAYRQVRKGGVTGPKALGVFGGSYLYPLFVAFHLL